MIRAVLVGAAFLALFFFPWPVTVVLVFAAGMAVPLAGLLLGVLVDLFYYTPGAGLPYGTLFGIGTFLVALLVHRFVKTRIMSE